MIPLISLNGQLLDANSQASLSPLDRGFLLGDGIFETLRVTDVGAWYLERHLARLAHAANRLSIALPAQLSQWIDELIQRGRPAPGNAVVLRITVSRGAGGPAGLAGNEGLSPTVVLALLDPPQNGDSETGLRVHISDYIRNERSIATGLKTTSYVESILALRAARAGGFDDAIFLDSRAFVSEATASNVFIVLNGVLVTPSSTHGILLGITRAVVLELAEELEIPSAEREVTLPELLNADEVFLTSSIRGIAPVVRVNGDQIGNGAPGALTHRLMREYEARETRV